VFYLPPADFVEWTTRFLRPSVGGEEFWTTYLRIGRFVYKNIYFWGPLATLALGWVAVGIFKGRVFAQPGQRGLAAMALGIILAYEVLYFSIPIDPAYLLPVVPFWLILAGLAFRYDRRPLYLLLAAVMIANFVSINVARPNIANKATGALYGLWIEPGHLIADARARLAIMDCGYQPCDWDKGIVE